MLRILHCHVPSSTNNDRVWHQSDVAMFRLLDILVFFLIINRIETFHVCCLGSLRPQRSTCYIIVITGLFLVEEGRAIGGNEAAISHVWLFRAPLFTNPTVCSIVNSPLHSFFFFCLLIADHKDACVSFGAQAHETDNVDKPLKTT